MPSSHPSLGLSVFFLSFFQHTGTTRARPKELWGVSCGCGYTRVTHKAAGSKGPETSGGQPATSSTSQRAGGRGGRAGAALGGAGRSGARARAAAEAGASGRRGMPSGAAACWRGRRRRRRALKHQRCGDVSGTLGPRTRPSFAIRFSFFLFFYVFKDTKIKVPSKSAGRSDFSSPTRRPPRISVILSMDYGLCFL